MGDNKNPSQNQNQNIGQNPNQNPNQNPGKDRETATQPGKRLPGEHPSEHQEPQKDRAGNPNQDRDDEAAKRQQRQDPLQQNKDRDR